MHVSKRHLPHHAEDPQVHGQQYADRQRHAEEVHRLAGRRGPCAVDHELRDGRCHELLCSRLPVERGCDIGLGCARSDFGMPNLAAKVRRATHDDNRDGQQQRRGRDEAPRRAAAAPGLPQREPREEAGELITQTNPKSATSWWSLMAMSDTPGASRSSRYAAAPLMYDGQRQHRDHVQHFQTRVVQVLVAPDEAEQQQRERGHRADRRHVVEQQMQVGEVHG